MPQNKILFGILIFVLFLIILNIIVICFCELDSNTENGFKNIDNPSKFHILMTYDKKYGEFLGNNTSSINKKYCEHYGYNFHKKILNIDKNKHITYTDIRIKDSIGTAYNKNKIYKAVPHYGRYVELLKLLNKYPEDHIFMYIDSDASLLNYKIDVGDWIPKSKDTYVLFGNEGNTIKIKFKSFIRNVKYGITFNSGIIILKNNDWTKKFLSDILYSDDCDCNRLNKTMYYDQSCISNLFKRNKNNEQIHIKVIPNNKSIQHNDIKKIDSPIPILHTFGEKYKDFYSTIKPKIWPS